MQKERGREKIPGFYQMACLIWKWLGGHLQKTAYVIKLQERFEVLYPKNKTGPMIKEYMCYKISLVLLFVCVGLGLGGGLWIKERGESRHVEKIERNPYWGIEKEEELLVDVEGMQDKQNLTVRVSERKYDKDKIQSVLEKMGQSLEKSILKENTSLDCVKSDLNLMTQVPDTGVEVTWSMDSDLYIMPDGSLITEAVTKDGVIVNLTAALSYEGEHCMHSFAVCLQRPKLSEKEQLLRDVSDEIEARNVSQMGEKELTLPTEVDDRQVQFESKKEAYGIKVLFGILLCAMLVFFAKDEDINKELKLRKEQMLLDYSEIVSKLTLLLGAGMTIRKALEKIAFDYDKKCRGGGERRYAYDEVLYVCREMQGGVSERSGLDMLSARCQFPCYMKLCSLLSQNLKKGSKGMAQSLGFEVGQAFEERKNIARKLGEEAGTKLLLPMILMLMIVMVVLIVPAFLSF